MADTNKNQEQAAFAEAPQQTGAQPVARQAAGTPSNQPRPCPKDCRKCSMQQQICCASLLSFQSFEVMNSIILRLDIQSQRISELETRLSAIQSTEAELCSPMPIDGELFASDTD